MKSIVLLSLLCSVLVVPSLAQEVESSRRQFQTELVLVTSSSPDFLDHLGLESPELKSLELLGASTAEAREQRARFLAENNASLMSAPTVVTVHGSSARMTVGEDVEYFAPTDDGHFEPRSAFIGVAFEFTVRAQTESSVELDSELRLSYINGRMSLAGTELDVGPPMVSLRKMTSRPSLRLGGWAILGAGTMQRRDDSGKEVVEHLFPFVRVKEVPISDEGKERVRARDQAPGLQRREEP